MLSYLYIYYIRLYAGVRPENIIQEVETTSMESDSTKYLVYKS